jgi:hypothetical protein
LHIIIFSTGGQRYNILITPLAEEIGMVKEKTRNYAAKSCDLLESWVIAPCAYAMRRYIQVAQAVYAQGVFELMRKCVVHVQSPLPMFA